MEAAGLPALDMDRSGRKRELAPTLQMAARRSYDEKREKLVGGLGWVGRCGVEAEHAGCLEVAGAGELQ